MIAGIDLSSLFVDVVFIDENHAKPIWQRVSLGKEGNAFDRSRGVSDALVAKGLVEMFKECAAVGIEEPRGMNPGPTFRVQGAVLQKIPRETIVYPLIPSQWRKAVGLKGNAQKPDIMAHVLTLFPEFTDVWPQDACDAWCVAEATRLAVSGVRC